MKLTYQRALWAAYTVLGRLFNYDNYEDPYKIGEILSEMDPFYLNPECVPTPIYGEFGPIAVSL